MSVCAVILVKYLKKHNLSVKGTSSVEILASLRLSARDVFFVVHCGPDVIAFTLSSQGACLMGRWNYEEWQKSQAD